MATSTDFGAHWTRKTLAAGPGNSFNLFPQAAIDKFGDIDRIGRIEPQFLQIIGLDRHVVALLVFVALDDLAAVDRTDPRHHVLIAHTLARRFVYAVEADALLFGGRRVETDRDRYQRKLEEAGPVRSGRSGHR